MTDSDRITALEARLAAAEARIAELEARATQIAPTRLPQIPSEPNWAWPPPITCKDESAL